jgi:uncharacterized protein with NRDE domain
MCVVALALNAHPKWSIILAGNRDELHARPSAPLVQWEGTDSHIIAGRDLVSGGTWQGVSTTGRLAVVTNIRTGALPDPDKLSRGALVADYLRGQGTPPVSTLDQYNPFSLLTLGPEGATLCTNRPSPAFTDLPPGLHGLSNGLPDEDWPRKERLMQTFESVLDNSPDLTAALLDILAKEDSADSPFIRNTSYGTRCSTIVLVDYAKRGTIVEQGFDAESCALEKTQQQFVFG